MSSFRKFLFFFIFISFFIPFTVFGMCAYVFSELKTQLGLSDRVVRVLYRADIHTIEDLTSRTDRELMELPRFGKKAFKEVRAALAERGLSLATSSDSTSVESLSFSVRASNVFYDEGIRTIGDLISHTEGELMRLPGFGRKSLKEVEAVLAERELSLMSSVPPSSVYSLGLSGRTNNALYRVDIHTVTGLTSKAEWELMRLPGFGKKALREVKVALAERKLSLASPSTTLSVHSLGLSLRIENIFYDEGIHTIRNLISRTEEELVRLPGFGKKSLREVKEVLAERGLSLKI